jgi:hypothetical protein
VKSLLLAARNRITVLGVALARINLAVLIGCDGRSTPPGQVVQARGLLDTAVEEQSHSYESRISGICALGFSSCGNTTNDI